MAVSQKTAIVLFAITAIFMSGAIALAADPAASTQQPLATGQPTSATQQAATTASSTQQPTPQPSEGFTMVPAYPSTVNPRQFIFELKPGAKTADYAAVKNFSAETVHFSFYGADPTVSNTGSPAYFTREQTTADGPGSWIRFAEPEIDLGPGEARIVKFTVEVPGGTAYGDYRVGISMEKSKKDSRNAGITIATRFITQGSVKVTADPKPVPYKDGVSPPQTLTPAGPTWQTYYFWISLGLFVISLGLLVWAMVGRKRKKHGR